MERELERLLPVRVHDGDRIGRAVVERHQIGCEHTSYWTGSRHGGQATATAKAVARARDRVSANETRVRARIAASGSGNC